MTHLQGKCVIDSYIADGGQGFKTLQKAAKSDVILDGKQAKINEILMDGVKYAPKKYSAGSEYPCYELSEI